MRFQISDGKRQFSRVSVMRSDDFGQEGKIDQPEKYMRRIKGPKLERRANHSTLRQNCTYKQTNPILNCLEYYNSYSTIL
jgi:hypothetical protein